MLKQNYKGFYQHNEHTVGVAQVCQPHFTGKLCSAPPTKFFQYAVDHERASLRASELYGIKNELFITYYTLKKKSSHQVEVQESVDKTVKQFFPPNLMPGVSLNLK